QLHQGKAASEVGANLGLNPKTVREIGRRYLDKGLDQALYDRQRPGAASLLDPTQSQKIVAMICADPPPGCARWTMRLIVEEAVLCVDEKSVTLHNDARDPIPMKPGRVAKQDNEYMNAVGLPMCSAPLNRRREYTLRK